jgi:hypothetical protein
MLSPTVSYTFFLKDAYMFYCKHDDTMNFIHDDESRLEVGGISVDQMFNTIGNAICAKDNILDEITSLKPHQIERTQEMINNLQSFLDKHNNND